MCLGPPGRPLTMGPSQASAWESRALPGNRSHGCLQRRPQAAPVRKWLDLALAVGRRAACRPCCLRRLHPLLWKMVSLRSQVSGAPRAVL